MMILIELSIEDRVHGTVTLLNLNCSLVLKNRYILISFYKAFLLKKKSEERNAVVPRKLTNIRVMRGAVDGFVRGNECGKWMNKNKSN